MPTTGGEPDGGTRVPRAGKPENEENRTVKRTIMLVAGIASLGMASYISSHLRAQEQVQQTNAVAPAPAPRTKIGVVNLVGVLRNYQKWQDFENTYKVTLSNYEKEFDVKKAEAMRLKSQFEAARDEATKEQVQQQMKALDRQIQDMGEQAKRNLAKYRDDMTVQVYREVQEAVSRWAVAHDLEMVMHYSDAINPSDLLHPANIQRKIQTTALMPVYVASGMDITRDVTDMLNRSVAPANSGAPRGN